MGAFSSDTPRLLWLCTIVACLLLVVNSYQVSADSKIDTDLVFDNLEQSNIKSHDNHPRIERDLSSEEIDTSPPVEEENWLVGSVKRLKRSISNLFNKNEDHSNKKVAHHSNVSEHGNKKAQKSQSHARVLSKRKHRQTEGGQLEADDYEDEGEVLNGEDGDYEYVDGDYYDINTNGDNNNGQPPNGKWSDDEDDLGVNSGEGSTGETPAPDVTQSGRDNNNYGHPKVYRFRITLAEPYHSDFNDRNSNAFRNLASRIKQAVEELYEGIPGDQYVTVVSLGEIGDDQFKVTATLDLDSSSFYDKDVIRTTLFNQINGSNRIGNMIVLPENFYFSEFEEVNCDSNQLKCQSGECVPIFARCDGIKDCNDNSDEDGCPVAGTDPAIIEHDGHETTSLRPTFSSTTTTTETPFEGSGENECRGDDAVRCDDGSKFICSVQKCDGVPDCDDGGDEQNCSQPIDTECAVGEFKCDVYRCIPVSYVCNEQYDCSDRTDEHNCEPKCSGDEHQCDNKCITRDQVCDGNPDCNDGSDEANCPEPQTCRSGEFACGDGSCIPDYLKCDGRPDCRNSYDESNCSRPGPTYYCPEGEFQCAEGFCIMAYKKCNGIYDCPGGSDEDNCPPPTEPPACSPNEFDCGDGCIKLEFRCDGYDDCRNGQDEDGCGFTCSRDEFKCVPDRRCIPNSQKCNGRPDCSDNSDEYGCPPVGPVCTSNQLRCSDGSCIELSQQCNGVRDCPSGSDEDGCPCRTDQFQCTDGRCIDYYLRCNRRNDCSDGSDEYNCPSITTTFAPETTTQFNCREGFYPCNSLTQCISREQICDGRADCYDLSDEANCLGSNDGLDLKTYPNSQEIKENIYKPDREVVFQCRDEGPLRAKVVWRRPNGQPLPPGSVDKNGRLEIPNIKVQDSGTYLCVASGYPPGTSGAEISVELLVTRWEPPPTLRPPACELHEATCSNGDCIDKNKVCDGIFDCADGSDENRCNANGCEPNEFQCINKKCILKTWRCDSDDDCGDGSDETVCGTSLPGDVCQYHQFSCHSNNQCIPKSYHCDVERDCIDGSDEVGCSKPVISKPPPPMVNLQQHDTLIITCTAVGIPTPEIVWRLNWGHIPPKCRTTSVNGVGELICEDIQSEDQGAYSCEAINIKGSTFAVPDTIVVVQKSSPCRAGYFNDDARSESECIKCFCFGHTTSCHSADLFTYQFQPPFDTLRLLGVRIDPSTGVVDIRDEPIFRGAIPQLTPLGPNGVFSIAPDYAELSQSDVIPYFAMPENYHGNQLKSYGGYLRYTVRQSNQGYPTPGPNVIISGNGYKLLHQSRQNPIPNIDQNYEVRFFEGEWIKKSEREPENIASREEIMMVLEDIDNILIKLQYNEGILNTSLTNIEMDSAAAPNSGLGAASYVEECTCPVGYAGYSCEKCADGYVRQQSGPWLGKCYKEHNISCPPGRYFDGRDCQVCPCPLTNPSNQFGRTCQLSSNGEVVCDCQPGYVGNRCQYCAPDYTGNPLIPGDSCRRTPSNVCHVDGSTGLDSRGRCRCKDLTEGPTCDRCRANTFYLSAKNRFGCIACFCMGITSDCTSSNWYREQVSNVFTNSLNEFKLVDNLNREIPIEQGIRLNQQSREIVYNDFTSPNVYYWSLPPRYLGDKITSYGGYLRYTLRHTPVPGGQSSRNSAPDVELVSKNQYHLLFFNRNQTYPTSGPQTFVVPLLEQYWQRYDGNSVDREHLLMALADLEAIYIKATYYTNTEEAALISVSLDIANERNTGQERALEVEQCMCPPGYTGLSCEDCDVGFTRNNEGIYLGLCEPCNCYGHSRHCDPDTGVCFNCRDYTAGDNCELCLPDYVGDPVNGIPCVYQGIPPTCNCDPRGSVSNYCRNGRCDCKINVEGNNCDRCRIGAFGLSADNIDGCEFCFCSGVATECRESDLFFEVIPKPFTENHGYTLTDQYHNIRITDRFNVNTFFTEISYNFLPSQRERLFWSLPSIFTGNKIKSYGGKLEFIQRYTQRPEARYVPDQDVVITGNGITIYWSNPKELQEGIANSVSVSLHPSNNWFRVEQAGGMKPASREDILMVLANIDSILIRATQSSDTSTAYLSDVTLETAVSQYTGRGRATTVEICQCPIGYRGSSCESCTPGYYKDFNDGLSKPLGSCLLCPCNNRSSSCEVGQDNRIVCHCLDDYYGERCEFEEPVTTTSRTPGPEPPEPPTISINIIPDSIGIYEVGNTVRYNCTATSRISPRTIRIRWSKANGELPSRAIDDGRGLLVITDLKVTDSGSYVCQATDSFSVVSETVTLHVGIPNDQRPRIALSATYVDVEEGQPIEVTCATRGIPSPNLRLIRLDNQPLNPLQRFENGIFRIDHATKADEAVYECIATNTVGTTSERFQVIVREHLPQIIRVDIQPSYYTGKTGDTVTFRCVASENTQSLSWSKRGGQLPYNSREDRGILTITNAGVDDSGVYICTATSYSGTRGRGEVTVTITESIGEIPTAKVSPERVTVSQGQSTEIHCTATGIPFPRVKWTKVRGELSSNTEQIGSTLYIRNAQIEDRGVYVCISTNIIGIGQGSAMVEVTYGSEFPKIEIYPSSQQTVVVGNSASLQCRAIAGRPSPTITWARGNKLPFSPNIEQMSEGSLRFIQITPNEEGEYICSATNEAGTVTGSAIIIVQTLPRIEIVPDQEFIRKKEGENLRLECYGTGNPQPNVVWDKYGYEGSQTLEAPSRSAQTSAYQEFVNLTTENEGVYICRAESIAGVEEKRIQLIVDPLPRRGDITERPYYPGVDATSRNPSGPGYKDSERPRPPFQTPTQYDERFSAPVGTRAEMRCRISNQDGSGLRVRWIRADNSSLPREAYESSGTLYIENVQPSAAGEYQCLGVDRSGSTVFRIRTYLEVISPPRITLNPPKQIVHPGEHAYINCSATGQQPISISWLPEGRTMPTSVFTRDGIISFSNIQLQDAGRYRCKAVNSAGEADAVADVIVEENYRRPAITADQKQQIAPIGSLVSLHCRATNPTSSIRWIRENLPLPRHSQVNGEYLYIYDVQREDQGRYYCEITTDAGTSSDYIDLQLSGRNKYKRSQ